MQSSDSISAETAYLRPHLTCGERIDAHLTRIDSLSENPVFVRVFRETAQAEAAKLDQLSNSDRGLLWGLTVSVKDMFDIAGDITRAGSSALQHNQPATRDATVISRLRSACGIVIGKTNMSELAYSGLGLNPHFGNPRNAIDPERIPGGSSSGAAVSVALGQSDIAVGSDTGGSVRIPAALNGVVGFKPSQAAIPRTGMLELSSSQDTVGLIARTVSQCSLAYAAATGTQPARHPKRSMRNIKVAIPNQYLVDDLDPEVASAFERSLAQIEAAGARLAPTPFSVETHITSMHSLGGLVGPEAYKTHQHLLSIQANLDPFVSSQLLRFSNHDEHLYQEALKLRDQAQRAFMQMMANADVLVCPTVPIPAPRFDDLIDADTTLNINRRILRNTSVFNTLDAPAISIPCDWSGATAVGFMIVSKREADWELLDIASCIETAISRRT